MTDNQRKFESIIGQVEALRAELGVPGTVFGVLVGDEEYIEGKGVTNHNHPLTVTNETIGQIGSITKTVVATAMMRLVEQGKLDLDATVRTYLPDFRVQDEDVSEHVTVRHLITHSAGWTGDVFVDTGSNDDAVQKYVEKMVDLPQLAPLDTAISYNNAAFCVAGYVIEAITDKTFEQAMQELIFDPLGMEHSFFFPHDVMTHRFLVGHNVKSEDEKCETTVLTPWAIPRSANAAGGISCHIKDLFKYARCHLGDGQPLLKSESIKAMHTVRTPINDYLGGIGLAWFIRDINGIRTLSHTGGTIGQLSILMLIPEHNMALAMLTNAGNGGVMTAKYAKMVLKTFLDIEEPQPEAIEASNEQLSEYVGIYSRPFMDVELKMETDQLKMCVNLKDSLGPNVHPPQPPAAVALCGKDQLLVLEGDMKNVRGDILRNEAGEILYLRLGSRINPRISTEQSICE